MEDFVSRWWLYIPIFILLVVNIVLISKVFSFSLLPNRETVQRNSPEDSNAAADGSYEVVPPDDDSDMLPPEDVTRELVQQSTALHRVTESFDEDANDYLVGELVTVQEIRDGDIFFVERLDGDEMEVRVTPETEVHRAVYFSRDDEGLIKSTGYSKANDDNIQAISEQDPVRIEYYKKALEVEEPIPLEKIFLYIMNG